MARPLLMPLMMLVYQSLGAAGQFLPVTYPGAEILVTSNAVPNEIFYSEFGGTEPYTELFNLTLRSWQAGLSVGVVLEEYSNINSNRWEDAQANWGSVQTPRARGGVHCARGIGMTDMASNEAMDSLVSISLVQSDPALSRHPIACDFPNPFTYSTGQTQFYSQICPECTGGLEVNGASSDTPVVLLEHGNADRGGSVWKGRRALGPLRAAARAPDTQQGRQLLARLFHWASDLNDAPEIADNQDVLLDTFQAGKLVSNSIDVSALLSSVGYSDADAGMGYCVYPGVVVLAVGNLPDYNWEYFSSGAWQPFPANIASSSAFTLSGSHAIRLNAGTSGPSSLGTATLLFAAWDGTTVEAPGGDLVLSSLDVTSRRGGEYATSVGSAQVRVVVTAISLPTGTTGVGPTGAIVTMSGGSTAASVLTSNTATTGNSAVSTNSAGSVPTSVSESSAGNPASATTIVAIVAAVVVAVLCVCLAVVLVIRRKRQAGSNPDDSASSISSNGPTTSASTYHNVASVGSYHNVASVGSYHNVDKVRSRTKGKKGDSDSSSASNDTETRADSVSVDPMASSGYLSVSEVARGVRSGNGTLPNSSNSLETPSANYDVLPVRSDDSGGVVATT